MNNCKYHPEIIKIQQSGNWRCPKCNVERVTKRRQELKKKAINYKGGKCEICSYSKSIRALEFHHIDPSQKDFGVAAKGYTRSWEKVKEELDKCILLCSNCHSETHERIENEKQKQMRLVHF